MAERKKAEHENFKGTKDLADAQIGDHIGTIEFVVTQKLQNQIVWSMDDYHPWYVNDDSPFGGKVASPMSPLPFDGAMFYDYYKYPAGGSLFAKQEFEFIKPIMVGETYTMTGKLVETYKRKGRSFFKMGLSITDKTGTEVMRMAKTVATPVKPVLEEGARS